MAWISPTTRSTGDAITAAIWNQDIKTNTDAAFPLAPDIAWTAWTPTLANLTLGNGSRTSVYTRVGRWIYFDLAIVFGSTSSMGTAPTFTLPVTASSRYNPAAVTQALGTCVLLDSGTANYLGPVYVSSTTVGTFACTGVGATYATLNAITATVPFTWTTGDALSVIGTYESAA